MGNDQIALEHNYSSNINHFYGRERIEQKLTNINMYGLVRMLRKSTKNPIRRSRAKKERMFFLNAVNLSGKSPAMEINCLEGNRSEWFFCIDAP